MPKSDNIVVNGVVTKVLPGSMYKVKIDVGGNDHELLCHTSGKLKLNSIKVIAGDQVEVEMSPYDLTKGRITYRSR